MPCPAVPASPAPEALDPARQALCVALAELDEAECTAQPFVLSHALAQVGRCYRGLSALGDAEAHLEKALRWAWHAGSTDHLVDVLCELAETSISVAELADQQAPGGGRAPRERARDRAYEAAQRAGIVADPRWEVQVLLRVSDVLDRCGDHDDATALQVRALRLMMGEYAGAPLLAAIPMPPGAPTH